MCIIVRAHVQILGIHESSDQRSLDGKIGIPPGLLRHLSGTPTLWIHSIGHSHGPGSRIQLASQSHRAITLGGQAAGAIYVSPSTRFRMLALPKPSGGSILSLYLRRKASPLLSVMPDGVSHAR